MEVKTTQFNGRFAAATLSDAVYKCERHSVCVWKGRGVDEGLKVSVKVWPSVWKMPLAFTRSQTHAAIKDALALQWRR